MSKSSEYYKNHREEIIQKNLEYYRKNKEYINNRNKEYFANYYKQNKQKIITRVQTNYYKGSIKKTDKPKTKNDKAMGFTKPVVLLENNIVISLID
jgi:hypothetical protein